MVVKLIGGLAGGQVGWFVRSVQGEESGIKSELWFKRQRTYEGEDSEETVTLGGD